MSAALSFERRRSRNFLVLRCIRKLAALCLALDLAVTERWIPSEVNVSDRPSRIHDPSDIRDKTVTSLLTTVVKSRTDHDELTSGMMALRFLRKTISMIRDQNGASSAVSGETEFGHRAVECEESETAAAHWPLDINQCQTVTRRYTGWNH